MDPNEEGTPYYSDKIDYQEYIEKKTSVNVYNYKVISTENIFDDMQAKVEEVDSLLGIGSTSTRNLLNFVKWDTSILYEKYYAEDKKLLAQIVVSSSLDNNIVEGKVYPDDHQENCTLCLTDVLSSAMKSLDCGHRFCQECWCDYLTNQIMFVGRIVRITCPSQQCECIIDDESILSNVRDARAQEKFRYLMTNSLVQSNSLFRWCPNTHHCNNAIKVEDPESRPVTCKCGHTFCFSCGENWHDPIKCNIFKKWIKKCEADSETSNWIAANTKECPKCHVSIEKNDGCNHMVCRNPSCNWNFCWVCMGNWELHGKQYYICNRYNDDDGVAARNAQDKSRADLNRFLFYFNRYNNHMNSLKLEDKIREKIANHAHELFRWKEVGNDSLNVLRHCRETLMFTYVFGFYVKKTNQSILFEMNQSDLESATENLSGLLERENTSDNLDEFQKIVFSQCKDCERRRKGLVEHVREGYEKRWWEFNE